jgi:hypothetical protein
LSACGSAALDLPIGKLAKGLKVTYKVVDKAEDLEDSKAVDALETVVRTCATNSFLPGTLVLMGDGTTKPIEDIKAGDKVLATDPETGETGIRTVTAPLKDIAEKRLVRVTIDSDGTSGDKTAQITATDAHPFWVPALGEWLDATNLIAGQTLSSGSGTSVRIVAVDRWTQRSTVHNLTVADLHTYYVVAGGTPVLVHNSNPCKLLSRPNAIARAMGYSAKEIKDAIHKVKAQGGWRGIGGNRNPDMLVDTDSGDVYPQMPSGEPGEVIGNLFEYLKDKD